MKKVDLETAQCLLNGRAFSISSNTCVEVRDGVATAYLFDNAIAEHTLVTGLVRVRHVVPSYTTRMRINAIASLVGAPFRSFQRSHEHYVSINGEERPTDEDRWYVVRASFPSAQAAYELGKQTVLAKIPDRIRSELWIARKYGVDAVLAKLDGDPNWWKTSNVD